MNATAKDYLVSLTTMSCGECAGTYAIAEKYRLLKYEQGSFWHCPYCQCAWGYAGNGENAQLKKELELERKRKEWAEVDAKTQRASKEAWQRKEQAQRAAKTRIRNRIANGVCPCCQRMFQNLHRHMTNQHPDFKAQPAALDESPT